MGLNRFLSSGTFLFFLIIFSSFISPTLSQQLQADVRRHRVPDQYRVFKLKNTRPYVLNEDDDVQVRKKKKKSGGKLHAWGSRPFSAMLPKGYVPPSGSSPCHNAIPTSINFYCYESAASDP